MKKLVHLLIVATIIITGCHAQTTPEKKIFNEEFNWTITIPENFQNVSEQEWTKMQNKGADAIEKTIDSEIINQAKTIFVFRSDELNYFESNYQPFDPATDGDYIKSCNDVNNVLYETFKTQMPDLKIDTTRTVEKINNLEFQTFKLKIQYPNNMVMNVLMYSRLFDKKEFTVNIMYVDPKKGDEMLKAWKNSKFAR